MKFCKRRYVVNNVTKNKKIPQVINLLSFSQLGAENEESSSPLAGGHKASFKSTKLARRARSFKDDFLGKISQIRSPNMQGGVARSHSPCETVSAPKGPVHELEELCRQIQFALKHFRDVITKRKLEMLSGNGTVVLDTVWHINLAVKSSVETDNCSSVNSATNHMYQSVARLIKLCDDVLIDDKTSQLNENNVKEIVEQVESSVKNLIKLAQEKIEAQQNNCKSSANQSLGNVLEVTGQRNSLPDIPLTPREREILEQTSCSMVRNSHSSESILRETSPPPPPKPPLPQDTCGRLRDVLNSNTPPPLPPKKKLSSLQQHHETNYVVLTAKPPPPDDAISLLSEQSAGSLDSMLNQSSREEDEIKALMQDISNEGDFTDFDVWEKSSLNSSITSNHYSHSSTKVEIKPPAVPQKTRRKTADGDLMARQPSPYDNVHEEQEVLVTCQMHQSSSIVLQQQDDCTKPPPLPPKKKHIMAYMEMFGNCSHVHDTNADFMRHSVHMVQQSQHLLEQQSSTNSLQISQSYSFNNSQDIIIERTPSPLKQVSNSSSSTSSTSLQPPALPPKQRRNHKHCPTTKPTIAPAEVATKNSFLPDLLEHTSSGKSKQSEDNSEEQDVANQDLIEELIVDKYLVMKKPEEDGPELRGGPIDALIIQATKATRNGEEKEHVFIYQEAFLTTYRTFITPMDLVNKLIRRYNHFYYMPDKKPRSREAFALIVRVVSDLTASDLNEQLQHVLMHFVQQLIAGGEITLAKALRVKHLERHEVKQASLNKLNNSILSNITLVSRDVGGLLSFKSDQIAEQMTLLDADLFMKIEIPEVLIWAQEQNEERSPNLTRFTEHFNKMSYWARTKLLQAESKDVRERFFLKFIKVMKHLRKINNYNSYLALLSALDSAPIRRLEWQKHIQEGLKEYCALIDSSSSFRAYRQALAETQPPCIPYIGLVLQDLTFVHIGNNNLLPDGAINFTKRWQQFNIVENMKKFKKSSYNFKKNDKIIDFFQNFDECIGEDAMWQLSESIKPRGGKKPNIN